MFLDSPSCLQPPYRLTITLTVSSFRQVAAAQDAVYIVEVLLYLTKETARGNRTAAVKPCPDGEKGEMQVCVVMRIGRRVGVIMSGW